MKHLLIQMVLLGLFLIPNMGQSQGFLANLYQQDEWTVGSWATYEVRNLYAGQETENTITVSILDAGQDENGPLFWLEIVTESANGDIDKMKVKMPKVKAEDLTENSPLQEMVLQHNDNQPVRMTLNSPLRLPQLESLQKPKPAAKPKHMGTEEVTTPAGTFETDHVVKTHSTTTSNKTADGTLHHLVLSKSDLWLAEQICTGVVKGHDITETVVSFNARHTPDDRQEKSRKTSEVEYELTAFGASGAESQITGTPREMSSPPAPPSTTPGKQ